MYILYISVLRITQDFLKQLRTLLCSSYEQVSNELNFYAMLRHTILILCSSPQSLCVRVHVHKAVLNI